MKHVWFWLAPVLFVLGCRSSQKVVYSPEQIVPTEKALLWKISGNGVKKPSWLFGTIHLIPKDQLNFSGGVQNALGHAQRVAFEIDMKEMTNIRMQLGLITKALMRDGKTLRDLLNKEDYALVHKKIEEKFAAAGMFERIKPMFLSMLLTNDESAVSGGSSMTSVEMELYRVAKRRKLESAGLETSGYQMSVFDSIPYEAQARMLVESLRRNDSDGGESSGDEYGKMIEMYQAQDISAMQVMMADEEFGMKEYQDILLYNRNRNWIPVMSRMMREKQTLFAVGAGHLGGPLGVIALLRKAGYRVDAVAQ